MKPRRTAAQRLTEENEEIERQIAELLKQRRDLRGQLTPAQQRDQAEENQAIGMVVRVLLEDDADLKRRMIGKAADVLDKPNRFRKAFVRAVGPIPAVASEKKPAPEDTADLGHFVRTEPTRPKGEKLDAVSDAE